MYSVMKMPPYGPVEVSLTVMWASFQCLGGGCMTDSGRSGGWRGVVSEGCGCRTEGILGLESTVLHAHYEGQCVTYQGKPPELHLFFPSCFC